MNPAQHHYFEVEIYNTNSGSSQISGLRIAGSGTAILLATSHGSLTKSSLPYPKLVRELPDPDLQRGNQTLASLSNSSIKVSILGDTKIISLKLLQKKVSNMVLVSDGNLGIGTNVKIDMFCLIWLRHSVSSKVITNRSFYLKIPIYLHTCATCSELPSDVNTMASFKREREIYP